MAIGALLCALLPASAQTFMTIKPFQIRVEVPTAFSGTLLLTNCPLRIPTNGATGLDGTGTNWIIANVNVSVSGAPAGCAASLVDSGFVNPIGTIPINMNTNNGSKTTNLVVRLVFDGTQAGGITTLTLLASGAGLSDDPFLLPVEVGKIWNGSPLATVNGAGSFTDPAQWLGGGAPGLNDNVVFNEGGTQTNSLVISATGTNYLTNIVINSSTVISSLRFGQTNGIASPATNGFHNIYISPNVSLAIAGKDGFKMLRDYAYWSGGLMRVSFLGTNGTFIQTNENASFSILSDGQANSLLDMSGLGNLQLDVNRLNLSDYIGYPNYTNLFYTNNFSGTTSGTGKPQRFYQTWNMAQTNYVKATYVDPYNYTNPTSRTYALELGRNEASGGGSGKDVEMTLGYSNLFNLDSICVGGSFCLGADFQFRNTNSYAKFRNADGVSRMSIFSTADAGGPTQAAGLGDNTKCGGSGPGVDFTKGTVDMLVDRLYLSLDRTNVTVANKGISQTSGFQFSAGTIDANTAILGYQSQGDQTNASYCYATMTLTNTAVFRVNRTLTLGYATASFGSANQEFNGYGQISIGPGGTVMASNIAVGGITKSSGAGGAGKDNRITLAGNATLIVSNGIADATPNGALGTLAFSGVNNTIKLFVDGSNPSALIYVTNFTATGTGNRLVIGGIKDLTYPADVVIMQGAGSPGVSAAFFDAGVTLPAGLGLSGTLSTMNTGGSNAIVLHIINRVGNHLVWRASGSTADWDYTTTNWVNQATGTLTNYDNPDTVAFDDAAGVATNINLAGASTLTPGAINMTNNTLYYTFLNGPNLIGGGPALNKYGAGTVEVDGNTTVSAQINQGVLTGINPGSVGGITVAAGAVVNYGGAIGGSVNCAGTATSSGSIAGTVAVLPGGVVTNSGTVANPFTVQTNALLVNTSSGQLNNIGTGSSGSPQVASGGILINNGVINGDVLFVNGTFEDLGGGSDTITLTSVGFGSGSTFIPGGDGIGTTTITSDSIGSFPGATLFNQGAQAIFKINVTGLSSTVLQANHLSFGASAAQQNQNGCTLIITNISGTPFSAGQTFRLFINSADSTSAPYSTGTSTNSFPIISPAVPGAGLVWDLTHLWANGPAGYNGVIGIANANSGPNLTNSIGVVNGTNIVGQFSWDPAYLGYRLETQNNPLSVGLSTNWTGVAGSTTNTTVYITNSVGNNAVFYRLVFP
ncbi:MAG: hypothetical protein P4N60_08260 [Verrucomicrobiae bacterium]|nr:hypothetical protein [Verrucomicrobiae bacterium]